MPRWGYISFFSLLPLLQLRGGEQQATAFRRRFPPFSFCSGGRIGIREDGERGLRWPLCIVLPNKVSLGLRSVCSVEAMLQLRNKLLQLLLRLTGAIFGTSEGLLRYDLAGSGVPDGLDLVRVLRPSHPHRCCHRRFREVCLPTHGETGLDFVSHLFWFHSPLGCASVRCAGVPGDY